jgi:hypothetical protein
MSFELAVWVPVFSSLWRSEREKESAIMQCWVENA